MHARSVLIGVVRALGALAWLACACSGEPRSERFAARLTARTPDGAPVQGAQAWADGRALGSTSEAGTLRAELRGREGGAVELTAACPPAYRTDPASRRLILRRVRSAASGARAQPLELAVHCLPIETTSALIVLASGRTVAGLPVRVQGEVVGQTEHDGSAHLLVNAPAETTLRVELDTSARPELQPHSPVHTFRIRDDDSLLFVEQRFTTAPRRRAAARRAVPAPARPRPQRID